MPVFRTIYAPVKQLVVAFSPDNEYGFKRVALVEDCGARVHARIPDARSSPSSVGAGRNRCYAVYVPTNHLYLGDVIICPRDKVTFPDITVEQGDPHFSDRRDGAARTAAVSGKDRDRRCRG